jgi:hypothetical protein
MPVAPVRAPRRERCRPGQHDGPRAARLGWLIMRRHHVTTSGRAGSKVGRRLTAPEKISRSRAADRHHDRAPTLPRDYLDTVTNAGVWMLC